MLYRIRPVQNASQSTHQEIQSCDMSLSGIPGEEGLPSPLVGFIQFNGREFPALFYRGYVSDVPGFPSYEEHALVFVYVRRTPRSLRTEESLDILPDRTPPNDRPV